jgi:hypothetical protein
MLRLGKPFTSSDGWSPRGTLAGAGKLLINKL